MMIDANPSHGTDLPAPRGRFLLGPRFAPGPLRTARRSGPSGAGKGAVVGGLVGLAVLAAFSLPLVVEPRPSQRAAEAPRPVTIRSAAVPKPVAVEPVAIETASVDAAPVQAQARPSQRSALSLDSLPTLTQDASDIDLDPATAAPPPPPRQAQKPAAPRRTAPPKP